MSSPLPPDNYLSNFLRPEILPQNNYLSGFMQETEEEKQKREREKALSFIGLSRDAGGLKTLPRAVMGGLYHTGQDLDQLVTHPDRLFTGIGNVAGGLGQMISHPIDAAVGLGKGFWEQGKNLLEVTAEAIPGIDRLTPDEQEAKTWQAMTDVAAYYFGGKLAVRAGGAAVTKEGRNFLKNIARVDGSALSGVEKAALKESMFNSLPKEIGATLLRDQIPTGFMRNALRSAKGAVAGAAPFGFLYGETPEERVSNAIQFGTIAAAIGGGVGLFHARGNATKAASLDNLKQTLKVGAARKMAGLVPEEFAGVPQTTAELIEFISNDEHWGGQTQANAVMRRMLKTQASDGVAIVVDLPDIEKIPSERITGTVRKVSLAGKVTYEEGSGYGAIFHKRPDGSTIGMVAPEGQIIGLSKLQVGQFRQNGFYAGQPIEFGGKITRISEGKGAIRKGIATLEDGRKVNLSDLNYTDKVPVIDPHIPAQAKYDLARINRLEEEVVAELRTVEQGSPRWKTLFNRKLKLEKLSQETPEGVAWDIADAERAREMLEEAYWERDPASVKSFLDAGLDEVSAVKYASIDEALTKFKTRQLGKLAERASLQGYSIDYTGAKVRLIDDVTKQVAVEFDTPREVQAYVKSIIQHPSGELVGLNPKISQELRGVTAPLPKPGRIDILMARFNLSALGRRVTEPYQFFSSLDVLHPELNGMFTKEFLKSQVAGRRGITALQPILAKLEPHFKAIQASHNLDGFKLTDLLEAGSYDDGISSNPALRLLRGRDVNADELAATNFVLSRVTTPDRLSKVAATIYETIKKAEDDGVGTPEEILALYDKTAARGLHSGEAAAGRLILESRYQYAGKLDRFSAYVPLELARRKLNGTKSRTELAKMFELDTKDVAAVEGVRKWLDETGTTFGIEEKGKLNDYYPRVYVEQHYSQVPDHIKALYEDPAFDHALHRLGVRGDAYIKDAAYALHSYAHKGIRKQILTPAIKEFEKSTMAEFKKATFATTDKYGRSTNAGRAFEDLARTYINEFQHFGSPDDMAATHITQQMAKQYGVDVTRFQRWADKFVGVSSFATMGGNPIMGLRDFSSMLQMLEFRFGAKAIKEIFELDSWLKNVANKETLTNILREGGDIPPALQRWYYHNLDKPVDGFTSQLPRIRDKIGNAAFQMTAQEQIYEMMHRAVFNWTESKYTKALNSFIAHKDAARFFKEIDLTRHDFPIQQVFKEAFDAGEYAQAGKVLARANGWEALGVYGLANYPIGWSSASGRLFGQFGKWPLWAIRQLGSLASRPEGAKEAAQLAARWTGATAGLYVLGAGTGINFSSWVMSPNQMIYRGGPAFDIAYDAATIIGGNDPAEKELAWRQLLGPIIQTNNALTGNDWTMRAFKKPYIPIPYSIWNLLEASGGIAPSELMEQAYWDNPGLAIAKAMGFSIAPWKSLGFDVNAAAQNSQSSGYQKMINKWE